MSAKLSPRDIDNLVSRYHGGEKVQHLAGEVGLTPTTLYARFHQRGVQTVRKIAVDIEHIITRYRAGETIEALATECRVSPHVIYDRLHERKVHVTREIPLDVAMAISAYAAGASMKSLATKFGVSRTVLYQRFRKRGVEIRGRSDANRLKWVGIKTDRSAVLRQMARAWEATRGREAPLIERIKAAKTRMRRLTNIGLYETEIAALLRKRGLDVEQQFAINRYNIDLAIPASRVAVEIIARNPGRDHNSANLNRLKCLLDAQWNVLFVVGDAFFAWSASQQILAFLKTVSGPETTCGKYRVVRCNGQRSTLPGDDPDNPALI